MPRDREDIDLTDLHRYDSAIGWEPKDAYEKLRKLAKSQFPDYGTSPFEIDSANRSAAAAANQTVSSLFGDLWRTGEVAVLFGEPGVGKSILATQIAESIARGKAFGNHFPVPKPHNIVYFDFELTAAQFRERYSVHTGGHKRRRQRYLFSSRLKRATMGPILYVPDAFKGDGQEYMRHWFDNEIASNEVDVFVIDTISHLTRSKPDATLIRNLKNYAAAWGKSFLVIANAREKQDFKPIKLADAAVHRNIIDHADSVFALARSTYGEDIRYLKHLKSRTAEPQFTDQNVAVLKLERTHGVGSLLSPVSLSPQIRHAPSPQPFLGFTYLGTTAERDQNRNYLAEALALITGTGTKPKTVRPLTEPRPDGITDGSSPKYLKSG